MNLYVDNFEDISTETLVSESELRTVEDIENDQSGNDDIKAKIKEN